MGYPVVRGRIMEVLNARQGQTLTREQLAGLTGLTANQVRSAMRGLVDEYASIKVVVRAHAWRMDPDRVSGKAEVVIPVSTTKKAQVQHAAVAEKPKEVSVKSNPVLTLELLGTVTDGSQIGRDETGQIWGVRKF